MHNLEKMEISDAERYRLAEAAALREFIYHHNPCSSVARCWNWPRYKNAKGYGCIIYDGFKFPVHRFSFQYYKGIIPKGMLVMHACDNPACFNPEHLSLGTHADNMQDMVRKGRHASQQRKAELMNGLEPPRTAVEERNEPGILKRVQSERERISWAWRNPA